MFFAKNASNFSPKRKHRKTLENVALGDSKSTQKALKFNVFPSGNTKLHQNTRFWENCFFINFLSRHFSSFLQILISKWSPRQNILSYILVNFGVQNLVWGVAALFSIFSCKNSENMLEFDPDQLKIP